MRKCPSPRPIAAKEQRTRLVCDSKEAALAEVAGFFAAHKMTPRDDVDQFPAFDDQEDVRWVLYEYKHRLQVFAASPTGEVLYRAQYYVPPRPEVGVQNAEDLRIARNAEEVLMIIKHCLAGGAMSFENAFRGHLEEKADFETSYPETREDEYLVVRLLQQERTAEVYMVLRNAEGVAVDHLHSVTVEPMYAYGSGKTHLIPSSHRNSAPLSALNAVEVEAYLADETDRILLPERG